MNLKPSLFPLTLLQSVMFSAVMSTALISAAVMLTDNFIHPFWILGYYFWVDLALRAFTDDFRSTKNPDLVYRMVFGLIQLLTGTTIVASVIIGGISALWVAVTLIFWYFGARNIAGAVYILQLEVYERQQEKRVMDRQREFAAQEARSTLEWLRRYEEEKRNEEVLMADLTDFLEDADQSGNGRSDA